MAGISALGVRPGEAWRGQKERIVSGELERLTPLVARLLAPNPSPMTLTGTNTYLVGLSEIAVVDPGPDLPEHVEAIVQCLRLLGRPAVALVTHHHDDHLPAARRLRERLGLPIAGHPDLPSVDRPLAHDEELRLADARIRALHTPGHTWDHVCYFLEEEHVVFAGDLVAGAGSLVVGSGRGELAASLRSLELLAERRPNTIFPGHGPIVTDARAKLAEYVAHRAERERQVLAALGEGLTTISAMVDRIYVGIVPGLRDHAARNVQAHLFKLEDEGHVEQHGDDWLLTVTWRSDAG
jgi:glyoxylase-like metal-dependent hydrolase (beta-lactamase superfamily II)